LDGEVSQLAQKKNEMTPFAAELIGTMLLLLLGGGVVANTILAHTKGYGGGWIVIATGMGARSVHWRHGGSTL
jgi:glycerol uptake facilitator-like aquaporin